MSVFQRDRDSKAIVRTLKGADLAEAKKAKARSKIAKMPSTWHYHATLARKDIVDLCHSVYTSFAGSSGL